MKNKQDILKKVRIKSILSKKGFRINSSNINELSAVILNLALNILEKAMRNARISGRKTIKKEDISGL